MSQTEARRQQRDGEDLQSLEPLGDPSHPCGRCSLVLTDQLCCWTDTTLLPDRHNDQEQSCAGLVLSKSIPDLCGTCPVPPFLAWSCSFDCSIPDSGPFSIGNQIPPQETLGELSGTHFEGWYRLYDHGLRKLLYF